MGVKEGKLGLIRAKTQKVYIRGGLAFARIFCTLPLTRHCNKVCFIFAGLISKQISIHAHQIYAGVKGGVQWRMVKQDLGGTKQNSQRSIRYGYWQHNERTAKEENFRHVVIDGTTAHAVVFVGPKMSLRCKGVLSCAISLRMNIRKTNPNLPSIELRDLLRREVPTEVTSCIWWDSPSIWQQNNKQEE